ncbi:hypothetical protein GFK26_11085 [Variovorax paradoxus]|uniref:Uncharacterized protein n=1 Tax=Variovorax paradoxus TaxID=34073 RepID=A0A5Q0M1F6_VARPD|nr:hypothetical protein [Variovorax paradoxus]QFZ83266.1 hypothetical protein GFK26_11085 [Variovorax paradoxus]
MKTDPLSLPLQLLDRVVPGAKLQPDAILEAADRAGIPYNFVTITTWPDLDAPNGKGQLFDLIFTDKVLPTGQVLVVTDESFIDGQSLQCPVDELRLRMNQSSQFMFDGDVIFLWREIAALSVFHHEGGFAHVGW